MINFTVVIAFFYVFAWLLIRFKPEDAQYVVVFPEGFLGNICWQHEFMTESYARLAWLVLSPIGFAVNATIMLFWFIKWILVGTIK